MPTSLRAKLGRGWAVAAVLALLLASLAPAAQASLSDPRPPAQRPQHQNHDDHPAPVVARTGEVKVAPEEAYVGDTITATYKNHGGVAWTFGGFNETFTSSPGYKCDRGQTKATGEQAIHLPIANVDGATSCSWKAAASTHGHWASVTVGIAGPCADAQAAREHKIDYAICAGAASVAYYLVDGPDDLAIQGSVMGQAGDPVSGLRVVATNKAGKQADATTDALGHYRIAGLAEGDYKVQPYIWEDERFGILSGSDFDPQAQSVHVTAGHVPHADFTVKGHELSGKVVSRDRKKPDGTTIKGGPMANLTIVIGGGSGANRGKREAITDGSGMYKMTLPSGDYTVEVHTPPPQDVTIVNRIWDPAYRCTRAGTAAGFAGYLCRVHLSADVKDASFEFNPDLSVQLVFDKGSTPNPDPKSGRYALTVIVQDSKRQAVGGQEIEFEPPSKVSPRVLVCDPNGGRLFPTTAPTPGQTTYTVPKFTLKTDDQGKIHFYLWPGIQAGEFQLVVGIHGSTVETETTSKTLNFPGLGGTFDPHQLQSQLTTFLQHTFEDRTMRAQGYSGPKLEDLGGVTPEAVTETVAAQLSKQQQALGFSLHPIRSQDGKEAALLLLPPKPDEATLTGVLQFLNGHGAAPSTPHLVVDLSALARQVSAQMGTNYLEPALWSGVKDNFYSSLQTWPNSGTSGHPAQGSPAASGDELNFTYFGFPGRPTTNHQSPLDRCAGITSNSNRIADASPIALTITDAAGHTLAEPTGGGGPATGVIPGAVVTKDPGTEVTYVIPHASFSVKITGTGTGKARFIYSAAGVQDELVQVFDLSVHPGATGVFTLGPDTVTTDLMFEGQRVNSLKITSVAGIPKSIPAGSFATKTVTVTDELGQPVAGATVDVSGDAGYEVVEYTDASGSATLTLLGQAPGSKLVWKVTGPGHGTFNGTTAGAPSTADLLSSDARAILGPEQNLSWQPLEPATFPWVPVLLVLLVALAGAGWFYRGHPALLRAHSAAAGAGALAVGRTIGRRALPREKVVAPPPPEPPAATAPPSARTAAPRKPAAKRKGGSGKTDQG